MGRPGWGSFPCKARFRRQHAIGPYITDFCILRRLRYKLEYSAVGFQLLPAEFSRSELQHTYEIVLDEKLDKRNFRRRMLHSGIIETTPRLRTGEGRLGRRILVILVSCYTKTVVPIITMRAPDEFPGMIPTDQKDRHENSARHPSL